LHVSEGNYFDPGKQKCIHDTYQAEACQEQAKLDMADRLKIDPEPLKKATALNKARQNAPVLVNPRETIKNEEPPKSFIQKLEKIGKAFRGGSKNLFQQK
jgi:hypothetical protein